MKKWLKISNVVALSLSTLLVGCGDKSSSEQYDAEELYGCNVQIKHYISYKDPSKLFASHLLNHCI